MVFIVLDSQKVKTTSFGKIRFLNPRRITSKTPVGHLNGPQTPHWGAKTGGGGVGSTKQLPAQLFLILDG